MDLLCRMNPATKNWLVYLTFPTALSTVCCSLVLEKIIEPIFFRPVIASFFLKYRASCLKTA